MVDWTRCTRSATASTPTTNKRKKFQLNTGAWIPALGFGTWQDKDSQEEATLTALRAGYRHIDTAAGYGTEPMVGNAIKKSKIPRKELFITTKLWNSMHHPDHVEEACDKSLQLLGLDYIDLYELHFPQSWERDGGSKAGGVDLLDTWRAMEKLVKTGKVKAIGVSNFSQAELTRLITEGNIVPAAHQSEWHPWLVQKAFDAFHKKHGIHITAYSPFGNSNPFYDSQSIGLLINDPILADIAKKHGEDTTGTQVALAWNVSKGHSVIPKSKTPARIAANLEGDFCLTAAEIKKIDGMDRKLRFNDMSIEWKYNFYADLEGKKAVYKGKNQF